jgi:hypothetical protein
MEDRHAIRDGPSCRAFSLSAGSGGRRRSGRNHRARLGPWRWRWRGSQDFSICCTDSTTPGFLVQGGLATCPAFDNCLPNPSFEPRYFSCGGYNNACQTGGMAEPRFKILDIVRAGDHPALVRAGLAGRRGCVTQIREYPGHQFRYSVCGLDRGGDDDDDDVAGIYDEEHLEGTGERASADLFALPGGLRFREVVQIPADCDQPAAAGRTGVVAGHAGEDNLAVWFEELGEVIIVPLRFARPTGERLPPPEPGRPGESAQVSVTGQITGHASYLVVDEIGRYL